MRTLKYALEIWYEAFCSHLYIVVPEEKYTAPTFLKERFLFSSQTM